MTSEPLQNLNETKSHQQLEVIKAEHQRLRIENAQLSAAERRHIADIGNLDDSLKRVTHELKSFKQKYKNDLKLLNEKLKLKNSEVDILKAENERLKSTERTQNALASLEQQLLFHQDEVTQLKKAKTSLQELVTDQQITIIDLKAKLRDSFTPNIQTSTLARSLSERAISPVSFSPFSKSTKVDDIRSQHPQHLNHSRVHSIQGPSSTSSSGKPTHAEYVLDEFPSSSTKIDIRNRSPTYSDVSSSNTGEQDFQQMRSGALSNESSITGSKRKAEGEPLSVSTSKSKKSKKSTPQLGDSADYPSALRSAFTKFLSPPRSLRTSVKPYYEYAHEKVDILLTSLQSYVEELSNPAIDEDVLPLNVPNNKSKKSKNSKSGAVEVLNCLEERERSLVVFLWMMMAVWPEVSCGVICSV
ncbi:hypothetical protein BKA69DRAFT_728300 [Paraphysoderma sedebokerense]|nr:hypothetical protein BKA69DRAFT_728300 [Paraphysoderma sedebokerense]